MSRCDRCGGKWVDQAVELLGGVTAHLCPACLTEWDGVCPIDEVDEIAATHRHYYFASLAGNAPTVDVVRSLARRKRQAEAKIRPVALEFIRPLPKTEARPTAAS